jgi:serine/threonine protein kinase
VLDGVLDSWGLVKTRNSFPLDRVHSYRMDTCPFCISSIPDQSITCPSCGAALGGLQLRAGTTLHNGALKLECVLGQGGFGITYLAHDQQLKRHVAVKELFPEGSTRQKDHVVPPASYGAKGFHDAQTRFLEEARTLAQFHHEGVIRVYNVFEEHSTAYMTMEYLEGHTLGEEIAQLGPLEEKTVAQIAHRLVEALEVVHRAGLLHRDIKPDNVFLADDGRVVLIDFGSARTFISSQTVQHTRLVSAGYAAPEQYASSAKFGPYTDIYGLSATLYHALTGQAPPSATDRFIGSSVPVLPSSVNEGLRSAVERGLKLNVTERPSDVSAFKRLLEAKSPTPLTRVTVPQSFVPIDPMQQKGLAGSRKLIYMLFPDRLGVFVQPGEVAIHNDKYDLTDLSRVDLDWNYEKPKEKDFILYPGIFDFSSRIDLKGFEVPIRFIALGAMWIYYTNKVLLIPYATFFLLIPFLWWQVDRRSRRIPVYTVSLIMKDGITIKLRYLDSTEANRIADILRPLI